MLHIINHSSDNDIRKITDTHSVPALHLYLLDSSTPRPCILILPGGGYHHLADHEGEPVARWLNTLGIHAALLEYSTFDSLTDKGNFNPHDSTFSAESDDDLLQTDTSKTTMPSENSTADSSNNRSFSQHTDPVADAVHPLIDPHARLQETEQALHLLRQHAREWRILPEQTGLMGFSAGGHLAALTATMGRIRPHLLLLGYPVITFRGPYAHQGSRLHFLGESPDIAMIDQFSAERQVDSSVPPTFIWTTADDASVPVHNSLLFSEALAAHRISHELHIMENGRHGLGLAQTHPSCHRWTEWASHWLNRHGYIHSTSDKAAADNVLFTPSLFTRNSTPDSDHHQPISRQTDGRRPTLFIAGDSTAAIKGASDKPMSGWGEYVQPYFGSGITVANHAINGRSTRSFLAEGRLEYIANQLQPGDYLLIQFGHNDEKSADPMRYTEPHTDYRYNLQKIIDTARQYGAIPVLLTSVSRRRFLSNGTIDPLAVGAYPAAMKQTALTAHVPLLDIFTASRQLYEALGETASMDLFMHLRPGQHPNYMDGIADDTHFSVQGAQAIAELIVSAILRHPELAALHPYIERTQEHSVH
ncbi:GDSL-type esterase/lipase family protein [Paenibacillus dauci]|uniref:GDSL-type esterase/lipase family protein n=1 Tax=Paenibacillus dauci TaxID=1567106 RepID=UPI000699060D|nr:GDSL-type esterase/lipase family protein [Paenibacillus dauci]